MNTFTAEFLTRANMTEAEAQATAQVEQIKAGGK